VRRYGEAGIACFGVQIWLFRTSDAASSSISRSAESGTEEIEIGPAVHLPLQELELGDLAFRLAIGPWLVDSGFNCCTICGNSAGKPTEYTTRGVAEPSIKISTCL